MDFPYRLAGRRMPDPAPRLVEAVRAGAAELAAAAGLAPGRLVLGGRSMGGRMCSMAVADGLPALGVVLLAYPLHPPKRPDRLRIEHLPQLDCPVLAISGTRDPFATPDELSTHLATIGGELTHHLIDGARHELAGVADEAAEVVADWVVALAPNRPPGSDTPTDRGTLRK